MKSNQQRSNRRQQTQTTNFSGYGPAGWKRGDEFLEDAICKRLTADASLDATGIQVEVSDGNVTLSGYCPTPRARQTASNITMSVYGVQQLNNHLTIGVQATPSAQTLAAGSNTAGTGRSR